MRKTKGVVPHVAAVIEEDLEDRDTGLSKSQRIGLKVSIFTSSKTPAALPLTPHMMRRSVQAGAVPMTTIATVLEFQRDWKNRKHYDALLDLFRQHAGAYDSGIEYAYSMVCCAYQNLASSVSTRCISNILCPQGMRKNGSSSNCRTSCANNKDALKTSFKLYFGFPVRFSFSFFFAFELD